MSGGIGGTVSLTPDSFGATTHVGGSVVAPGAGAVIVTTAALAAGTWEVAAYFAYGATGDGAVNVRLRKSAVNQVAVPHPGGNNVSFGPFTVRLTSDGTNTVDMTAILAGAAGSIYTGVLVCRRVA